MGDYIRSAVIILVTLFICSTSHTKYVAPKTIKKNVGRLSVSQKGINHIKKFEQLHLKSYWDINGWAIGYGQHAKWVKKGTKITKSKAEQMLKVSIKKYKKDVEIHQQPCSLFVQLAEDGWTDNKIAELTAKEYLSGLKKPISFEYASDFISSINLRSS